MGFDDRIIDFLEQCESLQFDGNVFRATRQNLDPTIPSVTGGRWMIPMRAAVLYTSTTDEGAMAEIAFHLGLLDPPPRKLVKLHKLAVTTRKAARIRREQFPLLGISEEQFGKRAYQKTQEVGAAAAHLGFDGLFVPSARADAENLILFADNHGFDTQLTVVSSLDVDWIEWVGHTKKGGTEY